MAVGESLQRTLDFSVSVAGSVYTVISGVTKSNIAFDMSDEDVTNYDDNGWMRALTTAGAFKLTLEGTRQVDDTTGTRDAGQKIVDTAAGQFGVNGLLYVKIIDSGSTDTITFRANVKLKEIGGDHKQVKPWGVEFQSYGKPTGTGQFSAYFS